MQDLILQETLRASSVPGKNSLQVFTGKKVLELLSDKKFQADWDQLYETCAWATAFQHRNFAGTWYEFYQETYLPVLVVECHENELIGLLALAQNKQGQIVGAGDEQAEYQVWLSAPANGIAFIQHCLKALQKYFPGNEIQLKYIPHSVSMDWVAQEEVWRKQCWVRECMQPLMETDEAVQANELRKKNRREKVNRLKRLGTLHFEKITETGAFAAVLDELAIQSDFRKGAMFGKTIFQEDPCRKRFLLALFVKGRLHATVLKLGDEIIASNVGVAGKSWVHLQGINTHSPLYAKYSPGILHFLMLGIQLAGEDYRVFDLTPGADAYKATLATKYVTAWQLRVGKSRRQQLTRWKVKITALIKGQFLKTGSAAMELKKLKRKLKRLRHKARIIKSQGPGQWFHLLWTPFKASQRPSTYEWLRSKVKPCYALQVNKDALQDLLAYEEKTSLVSRWEFLEQAMKKLEAGEHPFTWTAGNCLMGCVWLSSDTAAPTGGSVAKAVLQDFYFHPAGKQQWASFMEAVVAQVHRQTSGGEIHAVLNGENVGVAQALKQAGFVKHVHHSLYASCLPLL